MANLTAAAADLPVIHHKQQFKASSPTRFTTNNGEPTTLRGLRNKHLRYMLSVKKEQNQLEKEISKIKTVLDPRDYRRASKARRRRYKKNRNATRAKLGLDLLHDDGHRSSSMSHSTPDSTPKQTLPSIHQHQAHRKATPQASDKQNHDGKFEDMGRDDEHEWFSAIPKNTFDMLLLKKKRDERRTIYKILLEENEIPQEHTNDTIRYLREQFNNQRKQYKKKKNERGDKNNFKVDINDVRELIEKRLAVHDHYETNHLYQITSDQRSTDKIPHNSPLTVEGSISSNPFDGNKFKRSLEEQLQTEKLISSQLGSWLKAVKGCRTTRTFLR